MMFDFFDCRENPFSENSNVETTFEHPSFKKGMTSLEIFPEMGDISVLVARTGLGKTTLLKKLKSSWNPKYDVYYLHLENLKGAGLFRALLNLLGEHPRMGKDRMFSQLFGALSKQQRPKCLLMDEAQLLSSESMTDLRLLCGNLDLHGRLKVLLSGQPSMCRTLNSESLTDLRERITLQVSLQPMDQILSIEYLKHRMEAVGGRLKAFDEESIQLIIKYSEGVARSLNSLASRAMLNAFQHEEKTVQVMHVRKSLTRDET
jgi:MSHA biogenesis protein MshM